METSLWQDDAWGKTEAPHVTFTVIMIYPHVISVLFCFMFTILTLYILAFYII